MTTYEQLATDYQRIEQAIHFIEENFKQQPTLAEVAASVGLSEYHFQRLFTRWAGISPKRFLQFVTVEYAKSLLDQAHTLLDVTYEAGLSSPGRLHDLFITCEALTPGQFKNRGADLTIRYGFHPSPFGPCLLATTERGICGLAFGPRREAMADLQKHWPQADFIEDTAQTGLLIERIFNPQRPAADPLKVYLSGSNFQLKVWQALLKIPPGTLVDYGTVAHLISQPGAARAVGRANATNPVSFLIPCHRVIRKTGLIGGYAWSTTRKKAIIGWEAARFAPVPGT